MSNVRSGHGWHNSGSLGWKNCCYCWNGIDFGFLSFDRDEVCIGLIVGLVGCTRNFDDDFGGDSRLV